jgi:four helix bundle protein
LFDIADELEGWHLYRFAEQLRGAAMSMSNNISEGSGSSSNREFIQYLNIARRSTFENANIVALEFKVHGSQLRQKAMQSEKESLCIEYRGSSELECEIFSGM